MNPSRRVLWFLAVLAAGAYHLPAEAQSPSASSRPPRWLTLPEPAPMPRPDTTVIIAASGGARLYAAVFHRSGPAPVLLLHGGLESSDVWADEVSRLAPSHEVIVMDTRGHGRSTMGDERLSYALFARDAIAVLDSLRVRTVAVVGWSDGGITALYLAMDHPERVAGLMAYGANFDHSGDLTTPPNSPFNNLGVQYVKRAAATYRRLSPTPDGFRALETALGTLYAREPAIAPAALRAIRAPTTIADGDHEQFISRSHTERLAALIPGAHLVIMPNVSHDGPLQDPAGFHRAVQHFLARGRQPPNRNT